jgi:hypothetical protein
MAEPHVDHLLAAVSDICTYCLEQGVDVNRRLSQRHVKKPSKRQQANIARA